jgi:hypothetical protein
VFLVSLCLAIGYSYLAHEGVENREYLKGNRPARVRDAAQPNMFKKVHLAIPLRLEMSLVDGISALLVISGVFVILSAKRPATGGWWESARPVLAWLVATSPALLVGAGVVLAHLPIQESWNADLFGPLGTYAVLLSCALTVGAVWVGTAWKGVAAKIAALFALLTSVPLGLWGMAWVLQDLEFVRDVQRLDLYPLLRLGVRGIVPVTGAITVVVGSVATWQRRAGEPSLALRQERRIADSCSPLRGHRMKGLLSLKARIVLCGVLCLGVLTFVFLGKTTRVVGVDKDGKIVRESRSKTSFLNRNWDYDDPNITVVRKRSYASWFNFVPLAVLCVLVTVVPWRMLSLRARTVLCALCVGLLALAFSTQGETSKVVGTDKRYFGSGVKNEHELSSNRASFKSSHVVFRYRSWKVLGVDVWTWGGEYWHIWGKMEHKMTLEEAEKHFNFTEYVPSEYTRYPRGWLLFVAWVGLTVLAVVLPWRPIGRVLAFFPPFRPAPAPHTETEWEFDGVKLRPVERPE